ncbi:MAG: hypothetical protein J0L87_15140 [Bacteroidetes bacterium]|nr:hypothetical protein [Bacteroidota bacterium]
MNKILKAFLLYILFSSQLFANWSDLNTGIVDNLKGVRFWGTNGVVVGEKGFYYTQTGGNGPSSWNRFVITANYTDSLVYEQCSFSAIDSHTSNIAYICGQDTIANRSVIFSFNVNTLTYAIVFVGPVGSALNNIKFNTTGSLLFAVGDNGFVVRSNLSAYNIVSIGINNDLNSVSVNAGKVVIAGDGVMVNCTDNGSTLIPTVYNHPLVDIRSAYPVNSTSIYGVGSTFYKFTSGGGVYTSMSNYDPVILNGNDIFYSTSGFYIATNSGIYLTDFNATYAEFQVNSGNLKYNKIWFTSTSSTLGYAVGPNGLVVKTSQGGVPNKPYARILSSNINCKGDLSSLVAHPGSATNCNWVLNSLPISSTCGGLNYTFNTEGTYTLSYIVWNSSGIYDTVSKIIEVVLPPLTNITVDVNDSILCKKEAIVITLDTSQVGYVYSLNTAMQSNNLGACMGGNGSAILNSDSLDTGGSYFIKVTSTLSQCYKIITDSIDIVVEKTKANFHNSYINSNTTEINTIFDNSDDAQNYLWTFPVGSSPVSSSIQNPTVSFTIPGYNEIKLVVWSDNGCFDSIVKTGPFVYIEPQPEDTCWAFAVDGEDPPYVNYYSPGFLDINKVKTGYLISGRTYKDIFTSRLGLSYGRTETRGGVLCRYSSNGVLKWMIMNRDFTPTPVGSIESLVASCATDKDGNIYNRK